MLFNSTKRIEVTGKVRHARSFWRKFRGLMFESGKKFDYALVFHLGTESRAKASIHMLFVFFPICALFLDSKKRVVDKAFLKPFALNYTPGKKAAFVVEVPVEKFSAAEIGDFLEWWENCSVCAEKAKRTKPYE